MIKKPMQVRYFIYYLVIVLIIIMTSCSQKSEGSENITIAFAAPPNYHSMIRALAEQFHEQNPSITVQLVTSFEGEGLATQEGINYYQSLASSADSALIVGRDVSMSAYFLDLQPQIETDSAFAPDDFWPGALSACQDRNGRILGIPVTLYISGLFYDRTAFDTAGLSYPQPGWTWEEFQAAITTLSQSSRYGFADRPFLSILEPQVNTLLEENDGQIDSQVFAGRIQWYIDYSRAGLIYPKQQDEDGWVDLFKNDSPPALWAGRLNELLPGSSEAIKIEEIFSQFAISEFGFAPMPAEPNSNTTRVVGQCAAISAGTQHPQATWEWIQYLTHHWLVVDHTQGSELLQIPARQSVADQDGFWEYLPDGVETTIRYGLAHAYYPGLYPQAQVLVFEAIDTTLSNDIELTEVLDQAAATLANSPQASPQSADVTIATPEPTKQKSNVVTIRFFHSNLYGVERKNLSTLAKQFNQLYTDEIEIKITQSYSPPMDKGYYQGFAAEFDCFVAQAHAPSAGATGTIMGLSAFIESEDSSFLQDYDPDLLNAARFEGEFYVLPFLIQPSIMVYNQDLLTRRGLETPSIDWTFDDFVDLIVAAGSISEDDPSYGFLTDSSSVNTIELLLAGHGAQWLDTTGELPIARFNSRETINGFVWLNNLYQNGALFKAQSTAPEDWWMSVNDAVQSGEVAFWTALAGEQKKDYFSASQNSSIEIGVLPLPEVPNHNVSLDSGFVRGFYISNYTKHPQACWSWIKFLSEQPAAFNGVPARKSIAASPEWEANVGSENAKIYQAAYSQMQYANANPFFSTLVWPLQTWLGDAWISIRDGGDPGIVLTEMQHRADLYHACLLEKDLTSNDELALMEQVRDCTKNFEASQNKILP